MSIRDELIIKTENEYGENYQNHLLEQYKLYVEMADRISQRRAMSNTYFVTINSLILTIFSAIASLDTFEISRKWILVVAATGILISITWWWIIRSYRLLNSGKFKVIHEIEKLLPISPYDAEWTAVGRGKDCSKYLPLTHIEQWVPILFIIVYVGITICVILG